MVVWGSSIGQFGARGAFVLLEVCVCYSQRRQ